MLRNFFVFTLLFTLAIQVAAEGLKGTFTADAQTRYFWSEPGDVGGVRLHNDVRLTGIAYDTDGLTLRAARGQRIQDGFPTPLRLVLTQRAAPTRTRRFGRRIEFTHNDLDATGRYAYIRHAQVSAEQSKDLRLIGEDIEAGDIFHLYVYGTQVPDVPRRGSTDPHSQVETPLPDATTFDIKFTLGWNPTANHRYVWETRDFGDTASPDAVYAPDGASVEINRIACEDTTYLRFISYAGDLRDVLPRRYTLKIRKVWQDVNRGTVHLRVLTTEAQVRVEPLGDGSVLSVPKSIGSWTPEPQSPNRESYYQTIQAICADTHGVNHHAYIHVGVTETTGVRRAPRSPYLRKLTGTWGALKKQ